MSYVRSLVYFGLGVDDSGAQRWEYHVFCYVGLDLYMDGDLVIESCYCYWL